MVTHQHYLTHVNFDLHVTPSSRAANHTSPHFFISLAGGFGSGQTGLLKKCRFNKPTFALQQAPELSTTSSAAMQAASAQVKLGC
ncbi:hypothetical protein SNOG_13377 [Parastagonospora nodorum SN15]|uniref:Uncharacterized protein n=1 Tax=Phaeosphaeria nodorum (strain SN15 / ATCC MYA-4574 / FGSC 10173) TaxID=321614 RepID=Q0U4D7_PHANO|nr:hypothetical protein SNOG_13377 [Parastagonospora nodorum SN15]EAT79261.1 hypothetical protein SNOG_13377 [Parastagonospora nodorum SN15]